MLAEAAGMKKIIIACGRTDLRKGIDGLAQLIGTKYDLNPFEKDVLFLFCGSRGDRIRGLLWEGLSADFCYPHNCLVYVEKWVSIRNKCADKNVLSQTTNTCDFVIIRPLWFWRFSNNYSSDIYYFLFLCHGWKCIMVLGCLNACMPKN